ncbi:MAG: hypothetical protein ACTSYY_09875, partial [Promethearchaeota archaeon]
MQYPEIIGPLKDCRNCTHFTRKYKWELRNGKYGYWFYCDIKKRFRMAEKGLNFCNNFESRFTYRYKAKYFGYDHPDCMRCIYAKTVYKDCRIDPDKYFCKHLNRLFNKPARGYIAACDHFYMNPNYYEITTHATIFKAQTEKIQKDLKANKKIPSKPGKNIIEIEKHHLISLNLNGFLNINLSRHFQNILFNSLEDKGLINKFGKINENMNESEIKKIKKIEINSASDFSSVILNPIIQQTIRSNTEKNRKLINSNNGEIENENIVSIGTSEIDTIPNFTKFFDSKDQKILHLLPDQLLFKRIIVPVDITKELVKEIEHYIRLFYGEKFKIAKVTNMFVDFLENDIHSSTKIQSINYIHQNSSKMAVNYKISQLKSKKIFERNLKFMFCDSHPLSWLNSYQQVYIYFRFKLPRDEDGLSIAQLAKLFRIDPRVIKQLIVSFSKLDPANKKLSNSQIEKNTIKSIIDDFFKSEWFIGEIDGVVSKFINSKKNKKIILKTVDEKDPILNLTDDIKKGLLNLSKLSESKSDIVTIMQNVLRDILVEFEKNPPKTFSEYGEFILNYSQYFTGDFLSESINRIGLHNFPGYNLMRTIQEDLNPHISVLKLIHYFIENVYSHTPKYSYRRFWEIIGKNILKIGAFIRKNRSNQGEKNNEEVEINASIKNRDIEKNEKGGDYFEKNFDILLESFSDNYKIKKNQKYFIDFLSSIKENHRFLYGYFVNDLYPNLHKIEQPENRDAETLSILQYYQFYLELQFVIWSFLNSIYSNPKKLIDIITSLIQK